MSWVLTILGALVCTTWLWAGWRLLLRDRARGRARCPKCFYVLRPKDAEGSIPSVCPECGHGWKDANKLSKTRRQWARFVLASVLLLGLGGVLLASGQAARHGWKAMPDPVAVRLLPLNNQGLNTHVIDRARRGHMDRRESLHIARAARGLVASSNPAQLESGLKLFEALYFNSYHIIRDREDAYRPRLAQLEPHKTIETLFEDYPSLTPGDQARTLSLLSQLHTLDERVLVHALRETLNTDPQIRSAALTALTSHWTPTRDDRRSPSLQGVISKLNRGRGPRDDSAPVYDAFMKEFLSTFEGTRATESTIAFGLDVAERGRVAIVEQALKAESDPENSPLNDLLIPKLPPGWSDEPQAMVRAVGLWGACRFEGPTERGFEWIERHADDPEFVVRKTAVELLLAYEYSPEIEGVLRAALANPADGYRSATGAHGIAAEFSESASGLIPAILEYVSNPDRTSWSSGLPEDFIAIGGDPLLLINTLLDRVGARLQLEDQGEQPRYHNGPDRHSHASDLDAIAEMELESPQPALRLVPIIESRRKGLVASASNAHAALSGPSKLSTLGILSLKPDLSKQLEYGSPQMYFAEMIWTGRVIPELVLEYVNDPNRPKRLGQFVDLCANYAPYFEAPEPYLELLRNAAGVDNIAIADVASKALTELEPSEQ